ncbi:MAG TPA: cyclophilin-like fold protein [Dehalococcoidales bacterium]|nr:cyclophilin-like fold protein [Dehalococcoidales bacterium]
MSKTITIKAGKIEVVAELNETKTARAIWDALPVKGRANTWGDEIYFSIPVRLDEEDAQELVGMGDLGYWPPGTAFCLFFGPTPMSVGEEIRPASAVNVFGRVSGDARVLKQVASGTEVIVEKGK